VKDRYRILAQVGTGGFGAVYKAEDTDSHDQVVAIKQINLRGLKPQEVVEATNAFNREVLLLSDLVHPNLPRIHDHFTNPEHWYMVMDFIEGETLEVYLKKATARPSIAGTQSLPLHEVLDIGIQLCTVLDYLHTRQPPIIFRDLKPANIMRTPKGQLYLIDFGIARHFKPGQAKDTIALGSPGYAAPEQYGRTQTTVRSDIYSLGVVLHQSLSGNDPSETPFRFAPLRLYGTPGLSELEALILRMVEMDSSKRPASISEVKKELQRITSLQAGSGARILRLHSLPSPQPPPFGGQTSYQAWKNLASGSGQQQQQQQIRLPPTGPSRRRFITAGLATTVAIVLGTNTLGGILSLGRRPDFYPGGPPPVPRFHTYSGHSGPVRAVAWSPDGNSIASASDDQTVQVWTLDHERILSDTKYAGRSTKMNAVAWSPDSTEIASSDNDIVHIWDVDPQVTRLNISAKPEPGYNNTKMVISAVAWSPDGGYLAFPSLTGVQVWDVSTGEYIATLHGEQTITSVAWSPDGRYLASGALSSVVQVWDFTTMKQVAAYTHDDAVLSVAWSPDSTSIASASKDKTVQIRDATTGVLLFTYPGHADTVNAVAWSPHGRYIASGSADNGSNLQVWHPFDGDEPLLSIHAANSSVNSVAWAPDGRYTAAGTSDNTVFVLEVQVMRFDKSPK